MKKILMIVGIIALLSTLSACKGSKCDCPSFSPKKHRGEIFTPQKTDIEIFRA
ncbi:MAG: hypothetical protein R2836_10140 [Chitinophagales bacterium]|nr:hypothetical protein [Bacteroidota bacterium]MCB9225734.1 hypothetical protein [Chitinophagales bacterium]